MSSQAKGRIDGSAISNSTWSRSPPRFRRAIARARSIRIQRRDATDGSVRQKRRTQSHRSKSFLLSEIGLTGVEPALPKKLEPKSSASASSATAPGESRWRAADRLGSVGEKGRSRELRRGSFFGRCRDDPDLQACVDFAVQVNLDRVEAQLAGITATTR